MFYGKDAFEGLHTMDRLVDMKKRGEWDPNFGREAGGRDLPPRRSERVVEDVELPRRSPDVAGDNEALVARNGSGINSIADLRGKRVATPFASTAHYSLLAALAQNGLSPSDVQLIDLQPQAILAAWERGDIAAAYTWLPTLDELRKTGEDLITSRQLAKDGKPTLDLAAVSNAFAKDHPEVVDVWRKQQARALTVIHTDPAAAAKAIAAEIGLSPADVEGQLKQGVYLTPEEVASPQWLGSQGNPGNVAANLESASQFLAEQKQIPSAAPLKTFQDAIYTQGLPDVITK